MYKLLLILSTIYTLTFGISIQPSEFCKSCNCDTEKLIVTCSNISFGKVINSTEFWSNGKDNYPFNKVSINLANLTSISRFPNSSISILDLSKNYIQVIDPSSFMYLQNLTELNLKDNDLTSELLTPDVFKGIYAQDKYLPLKSLRVLNLANNGLHTLHQDIFEHTMQLEVLNLSGNPLRVLDTQTVIAISGLMNLKELDLSYTYIKRIPKHVFHTPKYLESLNLAGNFLSVLPTNQLEDARNLKYLNLNENPIVNITKERGFPRLDKLRILHLCSMSALQLVEDGSMGGLSALEELHMANNPNLGLIADLALAGIEPDSESRRWPKITKLYLNNNKLTHLSSSFLANWDIITEVDINDNPWSCDCDNQWMINTLVPRMWHEHAIHDKDNVTAHPGLRLHCSSPPEMAGEHLVDIWKKNETMRCLDLYGGQPDKDAGILIGILIGLLLGIPMVLGLLFCYKRNFFGVFNNGPASFSRRFYNPATTDDEFA